jgi:uncharacterized Fe-S center protein
VVLSLPDGTYVQEARIGRAILDADVVISLTHAKGCASSAFGGTIKNLGMGCGSRAGKMVMHSKGMPSVIVEKCIGCRKCLKSCAHAAIDIVEQKAFINSNCVGCGHCISYCPQKAVNPAWNRNWEDLHMKMAEYAAAVARNTQSLHVAIAVDITPQCDCFAGNDSPVVPNVGMFASRDPVALDQAVADAINAQPVIAGSALSDKYAAASSGEGEMDHFHAINPSSDWAISLIHAEELGIGTRDYRLKIVD